MQSRVVQPRRARRTSKVSVSLGQPAQGVQQQQQQQGQGQEVEMGGAEDTSGRPAAKKANSGNGSVAGGFAVPGTPASQQSGQQIQGQGGPQEWEWLTMSL